MTADEKTAFEKLSVETKENEFQSMIGFTRVWEAIKNCGKPLIGHNCFMDLLFTFEHFERRNPKKFSTFKQRVHKYFPKLYDTKVLAGDSRVINDVIGTNLNLEALYTNLMKSSKLEFIIPEDEGFTDFTNKDIDFYHDAGYDAFVTGCAFLLLRDSTGMEMIDDNCNKIRLFSNQFFIADFDSAVKDIVLPSNLGGLAIVIKKFANDKNKMYEAMNRIQHFYKEKNKVKVSLISNNTVVIKE